MTYDRKVTFTVTDTYGCHPKGEDDVYTREGFDRIVKSHGFIDYDGYGHPVKDGMANEGIEIVPSQWPSCMPEDATHVIWFNR